MCGIAGIFSGQSLPDVTGEHVANMLKVIRHRGPDGERMHLDMNKGVAMGHARLSINDLQNGHQPLVSTDKKMVLTVNGEFYDFKKCRSMAMAEGYRFATHSDSEIAMFLYRKHGLDFMSRLRGEFAFTLFDENKDQFLLVRDRWGIRPLFYTIVKDTLYYASEVKALLAHPEVEARLCPQSALNQLMQTMVPGRTAFKDVHALHPGRMLVVTRTGGRLQINEQTYWDVDFPTHEEGHSKAEPRELIRQVREKLVESIVLRLEADVPVGCYLSGGIDSCSILGLATGAMQSAVKAFTISFDDDKFDESHIAREMAVSMQADQEVIHLKADDLYGDNFIQTVWHAERTFYNTLGVAKNLMSRRVHECGYKTVITGEGSDELFAGYPSFKRDMILHGLDDEPEEVRREYQAQMRQSNKLFTGSILSENPETHPAFEALCGFTPSWIQPWIATLRHARPLMHPDLKELKSYDPIAAIADQIRPNRVEHRHAVDKAQYTWSKTQLEGQILSWGGDRVDMANSMESRPAFLDHHLAEVAFKIPPHYRIRNNIEKWVLREAVRGVLPEVLYQREKFAFMAPPAHTDEHKARKLNDLIETYLTPDKVSDAGLFDCSKVAQFLTDYRADKDPVSLTRKDTLINHLLCLQIMHHLFVKGHGF
jgi:asparagine synthase (glutamine-hydrolysing)